MLTPLRVLIIEDVEEEVLLIIQALKKGSYDPEYLQVKTSAAMGKALEETRWDIILCDYNLSDFSGLSAIGLLKDLQMDIPLIIVSGAIGEEVAVECMRRGARDCIRKENLALLIPAIGRELADAQTRSSLLHVEEQWRKSWESYRLLAETTNDYILTTDLESNIKFANRAARNFLAGREPVGLNLLTFIPPKLVDKGRNLMERRLSGDSRVFSYEWEILDIQGKLHIMDVQSQPLKEGGKIAGVLFIARDITERKQAEEAMQSLVERFDLAARAAHLGVWDWEVQGNTLLWDDRMYELYGVKKEDFIVSPVTWLYRLHPDDIALAQEEIRSALRGEKPYNTEFRIILPGGAVRHIRAYGKVSRGDKSRQLRMTGINYNITDQKKAIEALRQSERKYRSLFKEISEGFALHEIICDDSGKPVDYRFLDINPAFERLTGLTASATIGKTVCQILPQTESYWIEEYGKVALTGEPVAFENYSSNLNRYYQVNAFCPQNGQFAVLFTDITERKKMEAHLIQSQKMEAIGTLAGGIAHDFNNILGAIIGYADMAQEVLPEGSLANECVDQISLASERARHLVRQILAFSHSHDMEKKPLLIAPVIKEIIKLLRPVLPTTIHIKQEINVKDVLILADETQIHQVVMNLCTNAAHAMQDKGGTLTIGLTQIEVTKDNSLLYAYLDAGTYLELKVTDTGHGIDEKIRNLIFDPFFTTKKPGEGTGMGLSVVHGIVKSYGGQVNVESKAGVGTTFFVYLPIFQGQSARSEDQKEMEVIGGAERILLVDDHDYLLKMMTMALSRVGYKITPLKSSVEALNLFKSDPFAFDLVITDQTMPFKTGADLAQDILLMRPAIPIILCTGFSATVSPEKAKLIGIRRYVMKPIAMNEFSYLIRQVLDEGM